jgi:hypothetical protein
MLPGARVELALGQAGLEGSVRQRGQSTLEWVIGAAVILGTLAKTTGPLPGNHGVRARLQIGCYPLAGLGFRDVNMTDATAELTESEQAQRAALMAPPGGVGEQSR